ncbi:MAG TPA: hypothetical protein PKE65_08380 [Rhizobiaceae bacterium]|nr:hypothetical protein [Rhizobiaceae bacterium]
MPVRKHFATMLALALALAGCNKSDPVDGLTPDAGTGTVASGEGPRFPSLPAQQTTAVSGSLYLAPVIGAPANRIGALIQAIQAAAAQRGLTIVASEAAATHVLRGYFSAFSENGATTVVHVWDVVQPNGARLHRLADEVRISAAARDP